MAFVFVHYVFFWGCSHDSPLPEQLRHGGASANRLLCGRNGLPTLHAGAPEEPVTVGPWQVVRVLRWRRHLTVTSNPTVTMKTLEPSATARLLGCFYGTILLLFWLPCLWAYLCRVETMLWVLTSMLRGFVPENTSCPLLRIRPTGPSSPLVLMAWTCAFLYSTLRFLTDVKKNKFSHCA